MLDRQKLQVENEKLLEKLHKERERGKQLSVSLRTHFIEIMNFDIDSNIKAVGQLFLDAKNETQENAAISNFLKLINGYKNANSHLTFFSESKSEQDISEDSSSLESKKIIKKNMR